MNIRQFTRQASRDWLDILRFLRLFKLPEYSSNRSMVDRLSAASPWLAAFPSAWFVGVAAGVHLGVPWPVAVVIAAVIETQGITTIHTSLAIREWNLLKGKEKGKEVPSKGTLLPDAMVALYFVSTIFLVVVLEVWPVDPKATFSAASLAPAVFPFLAITGAVTINMQAQLKEYKTALSVIKSDRKEVTNKRKRDNEKAQAKHKRSQELAQVLVMRDLVFEILKDNPDMSNAAIARRPEVTVSAERVRQIKKELNGKVV